jgi:hypothetical protein
MLNELPMSERPDDDVLEDDERCDAWWNDYLRRMAQDSARTAQGQPRGGGLPFEHVPQFGG